MALGNSDSLLRPPVALLRSRDEDPRADVTVIEQLTRLEADNVYLREELKSHHDFQEIVGESTSLRRALALPH